MWNRRGAYFVKTMKVGIIILLLLVVTPYVLGEDTVFRFRLATDPPTLDPALSTDTTSGAIVLKIFDGLVQFDPDTMAVEPAVADSWEISSDGLVYTFHLKKNVFFHNGRKVTAHDVAYSFERTLNPSTKSTRTWVLAPISGADAFMKRKTGRISGIEVVDDWTVKLHLKEPYAPFLAQLCMDAASIVPRECCEDPKQDFSFHPVGCGPFVFERWDHDVVIRLKANDQYYGGAPRIDGVEFKIIPSVATAFEEYKAGGIDLLNDIPSGQIQRIQKQFPEDFRKWPYLAIYYVGFNLTREPFKGNRYLRRAINYAIDREKICLAIREGAAFPLKGVLPPGIPGYNPDLTGYSYDPEKAKELMKKAGYPDGKGLPEIMLWHNRDARHRLIGECIQYYLKQIGIRIKLKSVEWAAYLEACDEGTPLMYRMGWVADYPDADNFLYILLHSSQAGPPGNYSRYSNPQFDSLVTAARKDTDPQRRIALYRRAEEIVVEDAPWLFVYYDQEIALIKPEWKGIHLPLQGDFTIPLHTVFKERETRH